MPTDDKGADVVGSRAGACAVSRGEQEKKKRKEKREENEQCSPGRCVHFGAFEVAIAWGTMAGQMLGDGQLFFHFFENYLKSIT